MKLQYIDNQMFMMIYFQVGLKKRGFKFVGATIMYAYMQATGMVNDHTTNCFRYKEFALEK